VESSSSGGGREVNHGGFLQKKRASPQHWRLAGSRLLVHPAGPDCRISMREKRPAIRPGLHIRARALLLIDERQGGRGPGPGAVKLQVTARSSAWPERAI